MLAYLMKWVTITIDFSNAFVQSDLPKENPVWMHIPSGFRSKSTSQKAPSSKTTVFTMAENEPDEEGMMKMMQQLNLHERIKIQ